MNAQEYFDKTVDHLRGMKRPAKDGSTCVYLTADGQRCAVGVHIPEGHRGQSVSGTVESLAAICPDLEGVAWPKGNIMLARRLQIVHDEPTSWNENGFRGELFLKMVAQDFGLVYTPPVTNEEWSTWKTWIGPTTASPPSSERVLIGSTA